MTDVTAKRFDDMESAPGGVFVRVRADLPPAFDEPYTEHAHQRMPEERGFANHGLEEVYVPLSGRGVLVAGDRRSELAPGMAVRVGAAQLRKVVTADEPLQYLALDGVPGEPYAAKPCSELGAGDDPVAA